MKGFWQKSYVRENESMTLNQTYLVDLPEHGLLGSLLIRISGTQKSAYGQDGGDWRIVDKITAIKILGDQSTIIKSLTGYQAQGVSAYDQGVMSPSMWRNYAAAVQYEYLLINFGRWFGDTEFGLDLGKFRNVQLQVTNDASSSTEFTDLSISIMGYFLRETPSSAFLGFMQTENWREWTTVSDETKYLELPVDRLIRRLFLQAVAPILATLDTTGVHNMMDDIDLSLDTGVIQVYKGGLDDLLSDNLYMNGRPWLSWGSPYMNADKGIDMGFGRTIGFVAGPSSADGAGAGTILTPEGGNTNRRQRMETYEADHPAQIVVCGEAPFGLALISFDLDWTPEGWLDPEARKTVKLNIHTRSGSSYAGGTNAVILDRLVR